MVDPVENVLETLLAHVQKVGGDPHTYALVQGYPATGFARIKDGVIEFARAQAEFFGSPVEWSLFWDVRLFGPKGEWHSWKNGQGAWKGRFKEHVNNADAVGRRYPIWGRKSGSESGWVAYRDRGRGMEIWVPEEKAETEMLVLKIDLLLGVPRASETGIASVADAMITGFDKVSSEEMEYE